MRSVATCVLAACILSGGCTYPTGMDHAGSSQPPSLAGTGLTYYWHTPLPTHGGERVERLWRLDELVYALTDQRLLIAVDARVGKVLWSYRIEHAPEPIFSPCHPEAPIKLPMRSAGSREVRECDAVLINTIGHLIVLDRSNGEPLRDMPLTFTANTGGAANGKNFYAGAVGGNYHAFDYDVGADSWVLSTSATIRVPPVLDGNRLYVGSEDDKFYATRIGLRPDKRWIATLGGSIIAPFHVGPVGCYVPCEDGSVYAFDNANGEPLWPAYVCHEALSSPIQAGDQTLFQRAENDVIFAINRRNGRLRWKTTGARSVLANMNDMAYVLDNAHKLRIYTEELGESQAIVPLTGLDVFLSNTTVPAIYATGTDGNLYCIRLESAEPLTARMLAD
ncbi:MAG: PQQ-binding-like beta-propeller repeat protein [Phycisphaerae bacterium]|nr:PQQ-binding-like beta-propeller repeat protein [Phycisphaerae bacterium]